MDSRLGYRWKWFVGWGLLVAPWLYYGLSYPRLVIARLDHCPQLACDFTRHYLPQAQYVLDGAGQMDHGWFYPPLLALLLVPFTLFEQSPLIWTGCNLLAVGILIYQTWLFKPNRLTAFFITGLYTTSLPILHALKWGQISLWISVLLLWSIQKREHKWGGMVLGFAGALKLYPLLFVLMDLLQRKVRPVFLTFSTFLVLGIGLPYLFLDDQMHLYLYAVQRGQSMVSEMSNHSGGQALSASLHRWFVSGEFIGIKDSLEPVLFSLSLAKQVGLLGFMGLSLHWFWRRWQTESMSLGACFQLLIGLHLWLQPGWVHYFCWLPFVQVWCWLNSDRWTKYILLLAVLLERIPLVHLSHSWYFQWSRSGVMSIVLLLTLWAVSRSMTVKAHSNLSPQAEL